VAPTACLPASLRAEMTTVAPPACQPAEVTTVGVAPLASASLAEVIVTTTCLPAWLAAEVTTNAV
jgi:hypothetical protein